MAAEEYLTAALMLAVISLLLYLWTKNSGLPPGPWGLPVFGYYPFLSQNPHEDFEKLSMRYGSVFSFRTVGGKLFVVLHGSKAVKEVIVSRAEEFLGRPRENNLVEWLSDGLGVSQEEGTPWKEQRRFFLQASKNFGFGKLELEGRIQDEMKLLLDDLKKSGETPVDIYEHIPYTTNCVISHVLFNRRMEKEDPVFKEMRKGLEDVLQMFMHKNVVLVGWFFEKIVMTFFRGAGKARRAKKHLQKITDDIIDDHIRSFDPDHATDFVDAFLQHRHKLQKSGELEQSSFTMKRLRAIAMNMFMEGTESVATVLCSFLKELSEHTGVQKQIQEEMDSVVGKERMPSWMDRPDLPYLDAVIVELYRKAVPFNTSTLYSNFEETSIHGFRIPQRSILIASLWSMNNNPNLYSSPSQFNPERFLDSDGKRVKKDGPFPFGVGKRTCIGESLAQMEVFLVIAAIVQRFTLRPTEEGLLKFIPRD